MSDPKDTVASVEGVATNGAPEKVEPKAKADDAEPHWLNARLERERAATLKRAGFDTLEDAQASATELKAKREADKTAADRAAEALSRATKAESKQKALTEAVSAFAATQLAALTDEQKAAVALIAGDDAAKQLNAITALQPTWVKPKAEALKAVDTAPGANAPLPATTSETNHKAQYESLRKTNPFAAASYALVHSGEVYGDGT